MAAETLSKFCFTPKRIDFKPVLQALLREKSLQFKKKNNPRIAEHNTGLNLTLFRGSVAISRR